MNVRIFRQRGVTLSGGNDPGHVCLLSLELTRSSFLDPRVWREEMASSAVAYFK